MIIFDDLTYIMGGNKERAKCLNGYFLEDGSAISTQFLSAYPHVQLHKENGNIIGIIPLPVPESEPEIVIDSEQYLLDLDFRVSTLELLGGVINDL